MILVTKFPQYLKNFRNPGLPSLRLFSCLIVVVHTSGKTALLQNIICCCLADRTEICGGNQFKQKWNWKTADFVAREENRKSGNSNLNTMGSIGTHKTWILLSKQKMQEFDAGGSS